jgi:hypothetical protein
MRSLKGGSNKILTFTADTSVMLLINNNFDNGFKVISAKGNNSSWSLVSDPKGFNRNIYSPMETGVQFSIETDLFPAEVIKRLQSVGEASIRNIEFSGSNTSQTENGTFIKPPENKK